MRTQKSASKPQSDLYQDITDQIIIAIEKGANTFELPWHKVGPNFALPINASTDKAYQGVNILFLWNANSKRSFAENTWGTYRPWQALGTQVRKGEKATGVVFAKPVFGENEAEQSQDQSKRPVNPQFTALSA